MALDSNADSDMAQPLSAPAPGFMHLSIPKGGTPSAPTSGALVSPCYKRQRTAFPGVQHQPFLSAPSICHHAAMNLLAAFFFSVLPTHSPDLENVKSDPPRIIFTAAGALWLALVGAGFAYVWSYQNTPGGPGEPPADWPTASRIQPSPQLPTLVLMIHPHCPCSRATIGELALLMAHAQGLVNANVLFVKPRGFSEDWEKTDLWNSAKSIPGVRVTTDEDGVEATLFRSLTSGQAMLYDTSSRLVFSGGITASRGHAGDNDGRRAILSWLTTGRATTKQTAVFGCPLFKPGNEKPTEEFCNGIHPD